MKHPIQPLEKDARGVLRFKQNAIVAFLIDHGGIDLNGLARMHFQDEDRVQLAQLIGYSLSGFSELSYVSDEDMEAAEAEVPEPDPTPYCGACGAMKASQCKCGPIARNE